jgi:hypothetical protein
MPRVRGMNWRTLLSICAGVLLPLPLVLLLGRLLPPEMRTEVPTRQVHISPMLDIEQRMRLVTYGRSCGPGAECEPPLGCLFEARTGYSRCTDSQCMTDAQCPEDQVCRALATGEGGPRVRVCIAVGVRQEGEGCSEVPGDKEHACAAGLLCGGQRGWCSRPCRPNVATSCPEGFFCADTGPEPACLPTCEARGCPSGQHCIRFEEGVSICARIHGPNCQQSPCPEGRQCKVLREAPHPGKVWMECEEPCGERLPPCGDGKVCADWRCLPACDPQGPDSCGEGYRCWQRSSRRPFACHPDRW